MLSICLRIRRMCESEHERIELDDGDESQVTFSNVSIQADDGNGPIEILSICHDRMTRTPMWQSSKWMQSRTGEEHSHFFGITFFSLSSMHSLSSAQFEIEPWWNLFIYLCVPTCQMLLMDKIGPSTSFLFRSLFSSLMCVSPVVLKKIMARTRTRHANRRERNGEKEYERLTLQHSMFMNRSFVLFLVARQGHFLERDHSTLCT